MTTRSAGAIAPALSRLEETGAGASRKSAESGKKDEDKLPGEAAGNGSSTEMVPDRCQTGSGVQA